LSSTSLMRDSFPWLIPFAWAISLTRNRIITGLLPLIDCRNSLLQKVPRGKNL
jgi:hypothetical protein